MSQPLGVGRYYSDMHAMVLKHVLEGAAGEPFFDCLRRRILKPLGMEDTFARVPPERRRHAASCDLEHRVEGARRLLRRGIAPGTVHDPKARLLSPEGEDPVSYTHLDVYKRQPSTRETYIPGVSRSWLMVNDAIFSMSLPLLFLRYLAAAGRDSLSTEVAMFSAWSPIRSRLVSMSR